MVKVQEKRKCSRLPLVMNVVGSKGFLGFTRNISHEGCFIETEEGINGVVYISFELPTNETVYTPFKVNWKNNKGFGIEFILDCENIIILSRYLWVKNID